MCDLTQLGVRAQFSIVSVLESRRARLFVARTNLEYKRKRRFSIWSGTYEYFL